jgi:hypothetical protein
MLQCDFSLETDDKIKMHIKYRNKLAKIEFDEMNARLQNVCAIIQEKNPSLVKHICKAIRVHQPWGDGLDMAGISQVKKKGGPTSVRSGKSGRSVASSLKSKRK